MKNKLDYKFSYHRRLPHIQPEGATFFVTSRLYGSLPREVVEKLSREKENIDRVLRNIPFREEHAKKADFEYTRFFDEWDNALETSETGVQYLADPRIAEIVSQSLHYRDGKVYELISFCVMPNHLHIVFTPLKETADQYYSLSKIMHSLKRHTAREANLILRHEGTFWQHENYDRFIRDEAELERTIRYILHNPVKANLVKEQQDWKWSYCKYEM
jgi:REP element-mobilizing transposase RayT